jgi:hypothetical protein
MPRNNRAVQHTHRVWSLLRYLLLMNLIAGFVTCAYNVQIGMGIVSGTVILMIVALLLRIIGLCPDRTIYLRDEPRPITRTPPRPIQKQEYILVSNPDMSITIGTRVFPVQPPASEYPPTY